MTKLLRYPIAGAWLAVAAPIASAAVVLVSTPDLQGDFVSTARLREDAGSISVLIDTMITSEREYGTCDFGIRSDDDTAPAMTEQVATVTGRQVRDYQPTGAGRVRFELTRCRTANGSAEPGSFAEVAVYDVNAQPIVGRCNEQTADQPRDAMPATTSLCATGQPIATDETGADGTFNWKCVGDFGGASSSCSAPRRILPGVGASFTGLRTPGLLQVTDSLSWQFPKATACNASGAWSGSQTTIGTVSLKVPALLGIAAKKTYTLTCANAYGTATTSVTLPK